MPTPCGQARAPVCPSGPSPPGGRRHAHRGAETGRGRVRGGRPSPQDPELALEDAVTGSRTGAWEGAGTAALGDRVLAGAGRDSRVLGPW